MQFSLGMRKNCKYLQEDLNSYVFFTLSKTDQKERSCLYLNGQISVLILEQVCPFLDFNFKL
jgi:hypothetical protein